MAQDLCIQNAIFTCRLGAIEILVILSTLVTASGLVLTVLCFNISDGGIFNFSELLCWRSSGVWNLMMCSLNFCLKD